MQMKASPPLMIPSGNQLIRIQTQFDVRLCWVIKYCELMIKA